MSGSRFFKGVLFLCLFYCCCCVKIELFSTTGCSGANREWKGTGRAEKRQTDREKKYDIVRDRQTARQTGR